MSSTAVMVGRKENMTDSSSGAERLQKIIAQAGIASRRDAEDLIREGQVTVNGKTAKLGDKATIGTDAIKVKGRLILAATHKVYYLFYKPRNVIAMNAEDEEGRLTIKNFIPRIKERVFPVGRMDFTGEGAILLTNDGEIAQKIQKSNDIIRRYQVKVDREPTSEELARLARGGRIEGRLMQPFHIRVVKTYNRNALIEISFQGMGSIEIRKYFENKGFFPEKVARVGIGHLKADSLVPGTYKMIEGSSMKALLDQPELATRLIERMVADKNSKPRTMREEDLDKVSRGQKELSPAPRVDARAPRNEKRPGRTDPRAARPAREESRPARSDSRTPRFGRDGVRPTTRAPRFASAEDHPKRSPRGPGARSSFAERSAAPSTRAATPSSRAPRSSAPRSNRSAPTSGRPAASGKIRFRS